MPNVTWETFAGSTGRFALRFALIDPRDGEELGFRPDETDFGSFELYAGGARLTEHRHPSNPGVGTSILWSLAQIAEWFVDAADPILYEILYPRFVPRVTSGVDWAQRSLDVPLMPNDAAESAWFEACRVWRSRHALRGIPGLAVPNVVFRRVGNDVEISWDNTRREGARPDIVWTEPRGLVRVPATEFAAVVRTATGAVTARIAESRLAAFDDITIVERARRIGCDPAAALRALPPEVRSAFPLAPGQAIDFTPVLVALSGGGAPLAASDLARLRAIVDAAAGDVPCLLPLRPEPAPIDEPWRSGYDLAMDYRERAGWGLDPAPALDAHLHQAGVDVGEIDFDDEQIHGFSLRGPGLRTTVRINRRSRRFGSPGARRMLLAHELCHLVHDSAGGLTSILSGDTADWAPEARANAFAAELLMPRIAVRERIAGRPIDAGVIGELTAHFDVSPLAVTRHLQNLRAISRDDQARIYAAFAQPATTPA